MGKISNNGKKNLLISIRLDKTKDTFFLNLKSSDDVRLQCRNEERECGCDECLLNCWFNAGFPNIGDITNRWVISTVGWARSK